MEDRGVVDAIRFRNGSLPNRQIGFQESARQSLPMGQPRRYLPLLSDDITTQQPLLNVDLESTTRV
jgi:hypothetical protein